MQARAARRAAAFDQDRTLTAEDLVGAACAAKFLLQMGCDRLSARSP
jgi:hypothetical protein